ncbi:MAG: 3'(2'),5'-bisphosphate nucleotidase CysQ [Nitrospiraceae bacterium]|nr:3'(2'),5'-bisphosphate nucleotidase CysQ [Nitrospiraceae bacterium]
MKTTDLLQSLMAVSRDAGRAVLEVYNSDFAVEQKEDKSPLTLADTRSHGIISAYLKKHFAFPVLSEEGRDIPYGERRTWGYYWLVDPLDGTKEFVKRHGDFTVNIALIHEARPVAGVIYVPVTGVLYYAQKGVGSFRVENGKITKLPVKGEKDLLTIVGSRSHATPELEQYIQEMKKKYGELEVISCGSSLKFCMVAEGKAEVYPRLGPTMEWDTAAGQIIVEEAGGQVVEFETRTPMLYNKENLLNPFFLAVKGNRYV